MCIVYELKVMDWSIKIVAKAIWRMKFSKILSDSHPDLRSPAKGGLNENLCLPFRQFFLSCPWRATDRSPHLVLPPGRYSQRKRTQAHLSDENMDQLSKVASNTCLNYDIFDLLNLIIRRGALLMVINFLTGNKSPWCYKRYWSTRLKPHERATFLMRCCLIARF